MLVLPPPPSRWRSFIMKNRTDPKEIKSHFLKNLAALILSVALAWILVKSGAVDVFLSGVGDGIVGSLIAGFFFTSVITVGPAVVALAALAQNESIFIVALIGALGSVAGDFLIFKFVRDRITDDFLALVERPKVVRLIHVLHLEIFRYFLPLIGAIIIASPLPDEIGLAMMGVSKISGRKFFLISYLANLFGILTVGFAAQALVG